MSQREVRLLRQQLALAQLAASSSSSGSGAPLSGVDLALGSPSRRLVGCRLRRPASPHHPTEKGLEFRAGDLSRACTTSVWSWCPTDVQLVYQISKSPVTPLHSHSRLVPDQQARTVWVTGAGVRGTLATRHPSSRGDPATLHALARQHATTPTLNASVVDRLEQTNKQRGLLGDSLLSVPVWSVCEPGCQAHSLLQGTPDPTPRPPRQSSHTGESHRGLNLLSCSDLCR